MSARSVPLLITAAALAAPLGVAAPAGAAASKFQSCSGTANHGEQSAIKVRKVTCKNAINFLNSIASLPPTSTKQDGAYTVATLKAKGWVCNVRFATPTADKPNVSKARAGSCTASKERAIKFTGH